MTRGYVKRHLDLKIGKDPRGVRVELECGAIGRCRVIHCLPGIIPGTRTPIPEDGIPDDGLMPGTEYLSEDGKTRQPIPKWDPLTKTLIVPELSDKLNDGTTVEQNYPPPPPIQNRLLPPSVIR